LLQYLHSRGIVHGDLKTLNALYVEVGSLYKWCDFGFSKKIKEVQSLASQSASIAAETGTLFWMAPELLTAEVHICALIVVDFP
jgi:serine/threonine protein kinase